jgi:hypothetical protein
MEKRYFLGWTQAEDTNQAKWGIDEFFSKVLSWKPDCFFPMAAHTDLS